MAVGAPWPHMIFSFNHVFVLFSEHGIIINCHEVRCEETDIQMEIVILDLTGRRFWWDFSSYRFAM